MCLVCIRYICQACLPSPPFCQSVCQPASLRLHKDNSCHFAYTFRTSCRSQFPARHTHTHSIYTATHVCKLVEIVACCVRVFAMRIEFVTFSLSLSLSGKSLSRNKNSIASRACGVLVVFLIACWKLYTSATHSLLPRPFPLSFLLGNLFATESYLLL